MLNSATAASAVARFPLYFPGIIIIGVGGLAFLARSTWRLVSSVKVVDFLIGGSWFDSLVGGSWFDSLVDGSFVIVVLGNFGSFGNCVVLDANRMVRFPFSRNQVREHGRVEGKKLGTRTAP